MYRVSLRVTVEDVYDDENSPSFHRGGLLGQIGPIMEEIVHSLVDKSLNLKGDRKTPVNDKNGGTNNSGNVEPQGTKPRPRPSNAGKRKQAPTGSTSGADNCTLGRSGSKRARAHEGFLQGLNKNTKPEAVKEMIVNFERRQLEIMRRLEVKQSENQQSYSDLQAELQERQAKILLDMQLEIETSQGNLRAEIDDKMLSFQTDYEAQQAKLLAELRRKQEDLQRQQADLQTNILKRQMTLQQDLWRRQADTQTSLKTQLASIVTQAEETATRRQSELQASIQSRPKVLKRDHLDMWKELTSAVKLDVGPLTQNLVTILESKNGEDNAKRAQASHSGTSFSGGNLKVDENGVIDLT